MLVAHVMTGAGYTKSGSPIDPVEARTVVSVALHKLAEKFGGGTVTEHRGSYVHTDGRIATEVGYTFTILGGADGEAVHFNNTVNAFAEWLRLALYQESVAVETRHCNGRFIDGPASL